MKKYGVLNLFAGFPRGKGALNMGDLHYDQHTITGNSGSTMKDLLSEASIHNAMVTHAAVGGSTNLILHLPAIAHAAGLPRPTVDDWTRVNRQIPRLVDVLPNGPRGHATVQVFLAGGVPELMLHLRRAGLLELDAVTASGLDHVTESRRHNHPAFGVNRMKRAPSEHRPHFLN